MKDPPQLVPVTRYDKESFLRMAIQHFTELNPAFHPRDDWRECYFETLLSSSGCFPCWIVSRGERVGFMVYGIEPHRFLPQRTGMIYELYIMPEFRRRGIAEACARQALERLQALEVSKIQLEVVAGNKRAALLWRKLGFEKVSERFVLAG